MVRKKCFCLYKTAQTFEPSFWSLNICLAPMAICRWPRSMFMFMILNLHFGYKFLFLSIQNWISNSFSLHFHRTYFCLLHITLFNEDFNFLPFFFVHFRCFLLLLLVAAILWKLKQKYDMYRRRQVKHT